MLLLWIETVAVSLTSHIMIDRFGIGNSFLFYGITTGICLLYVIEKMKESKGKSRA